MVRSVQIGDRTVGPGAPALVIAEVGYNFNGDYELAHKLIDEAADAGADVIKFQTYTASGHVSARADHKQWSALTHTELPQERHRELMQHVEERGRIFTSTPSDEADADFLEELGVPVFKLGSDDCSNYQYLRYIARKGKPMIVSTGTCTMGEVHGAVETILGEGNDQLILLQCTTSYPSEIQYANLRAIQTMRDAFQLPVGYSDHTLGLTAIIAAVALGARVVEKHYTYDSAAPGPDHILSSDIEEFKRLVQAVRDTEAGLGSPIKAPSAIEAPMLQSFRKSVVARVAIVTGTRISADMITVKRPAAGIPAKYYDQVIGRVAAVDIVEDESITWEMV
jgi:N,N'-diacetyllegionaminate synthase